MFLYPCTSLELGPRLFYIGGGGIEYEHCIGRAWPDYFLVYKATADIIIDMCGCT